MVIVNFISVSPPLGDIRELQRSVWVEEEIEKPQEREEDVATYNLELET